MTTIAVGLTVAGGLAAAPLTFAVQAPGGACPDLEIIDARATTERPGPGVLLTPLAQQITRRLPQTVRTTTVDYPASFNYTSSVRAGVAALKDDITGTAGSRTRGTSALPDVLASRVSSVLLFSDPTFTAGEDLNVTDGTASGVFARGAGRLDRVADLTQSFCNRNDRFCQSGRSVAAHLAYQKFIDRATAFAADRAG